MNNAQHWIDKLSLIPHPEGGYYKETYRATETITILPPRFSGPRNFSTSIYFLLRYEDRSLFHKIKSDELWHFYKGTSLTIYTLENDEVKTYLLGDDIENGESLQVLIPANTWFGAKVNDTNSFTLAGCTVAPGFDFSDFEMAERSQLLKEFPACEKVINLLTKEQS